MFAKLLVLLALGVAVAHGAECKANGTGGSSTGPAEGATSGTFCYYSDAECKTADETSCTTWLATMKAACKAADQSCSLPDKCTNGCFSGSGASQVATSAFVALAAAVVSQLF